MTLMAERVENNGKSRIIVPKQNLLLELTENFKILSGVVSNLCFFKNSQVILITNQIQKQL